MSTHMTREHVHKHLCAWPMALPTFGTGYKQAHSTRAEWPQRFLMPTIALVRYHGQDRHHLRWQSPPTFRFQHTRPARLAHNVASCTPRALCSHTRMLRTEYEWLPTHLCLLSLHTILLGRHHSHTRMLVTVPTCSLYHTNSRPKSIVNLGLRLRRHTRAQEI
jgi:hypothetical protein